MSGKVVAINADLENKPELVNEDCYGKGWMIAIAPRRRDPGAQRAARRRQYRELLKTVAH